MATYLADKVICFEGIPAKESTCTTPQSMLSGMNRFLKLMEISFRRDPTNFRPRINKHGSQKDQEQKSAGNYFLQDVKLTKEEEEEEAANSHQKKRQIKRVVKKKSLQKKSLLRSQRKMPIIENYHK